MMGRPGRVSPPHRGHADSLVVQEVRPPAEAGSDGRDGASPGRGSGSASRPRTPASFSFRSVRSGCVLHVRKKIPASIVSLSTISSTFDSFFKVLFIFPSRYLYAIGLPPVFSFGRKLPPSFGLQSRAARLDEGVARHASAASFEAQGRGSWLLPPVLPWPTAGRPAWGRAGGRRGNLEQDSRLLWCPFPGDLGPGPLRTTDLRKTTTPGARGREARSGFRA